MYLDCLLPGRASNCICGEKPPTIPVEWEVVDRQASGPTLFALSARRLRIYRPVEPESASKSQILRAAFIFQRLFAALCLSGLALRQARFASLIFVARLRRDRRSTSRLFSGLASFQAFARSLTHSLHDELATSRCAVVPVRGRFASEVARQCNALSLGTRNDLTAPNPQ